MILRTLSLLLLLLMPHVCGADSFSSVPSARDHADKVMSKVAAGDLEDGLNMLKPYFGIPPAEFEAMVGQVKLQVPMISQRFGKSLGKEFIREDKVGDSLVRFIYLQKFEKHAMPWNFYLYKSKTGWGFVKFDFHDRVHELFR